MQFLSDGFFEAMNVPSNLPSFNLLQIIAGVKVEEFSCMFIHCLIALMAAVVLLIKY